jgi:hypothetical protein
MTGDKRRLWIGIGLILVVAFLIVALPNGGSVTALVNNTLQAVFLVLIGIALARAYRTQGEWLSSLSDRDRGIVYGALAVGTLAIVATARFKSLWNGGIVLVVLILAACAGAIYWVWRESRRWVI